MIKQKSKQDRYNSPVKAIFTGISDLFKKSSDSLSLGIDDRLDGKKVLITGSSSGLGFATALEVARRGAHVIMAVRSGIPDKGENVKKKSESEKVDMIKLDLSDLQSLRNTAKEVKQRFGKIDILICNAAMVASKSRPVALELDEMFVVNYFSKFLMINYLLEKDCLNTVGDSLPRIIIVASESHRNADKIEWESFGSYMPYGTNKSVFMYGYYKLLLLTLVNELSRRLNSGEQTPISVHSLCPGPVNSNIAREAPKLFQPLLKLVFRIFFRSPEKASKPVIYLAASSDIEGQTGKYLFLMNEKAMDEKATDKENGKRLWELSEELRKKHKL
ncbi:SDR family NAD(P)-dependent oxidoreductase [Bacteroidota bacterium]